MEKLRKLANDIYVSDHMIKGLSDMEGLSVEWDGIYGKHWQSFDSAEEMKNELDKVEREAKAKIEEIYQELLSKKKAEAAAREASRNTLGNLFPELGEIFRPDFT